MTDTTTEATTPVTAVALPPLPAIAVADLTALWTKILGYIALPIMCTPASWGLKSLLSMAQAAVASPTVMATVTNAINMARADGYSLSTVESEVVAGVQALEGKA